MGKIRDLSGMKFGKLTALEIAYRKNKRIYWKCLCDCGNISHSSVANLISGSTKSCGCVGFEKISKMNVTHGMSKTRLMTVHMNIKQRCLNHTRHDYNRYGGRGITVCDEWQDFATFKDWALANGYRKDLTIDRIDSNGNYEPSNCRWITISDQQRNRGNNIIAEVNGISKKIHEWSEITGILEQTLRSRWHRGKRGEELIAPVPYHR